MVDKKTDLRFTIQFSRDDPLHEYVADLLNRRGRKKAQFIVDAILFFEQNEGKSVPNPEKVDKRTIERVLRKLLKEYGIDGSAQAAAPIKPATNTSAESTDINFDSSVDGLEMEQLSIITDALQAFRQK